jgi:DNA repair exonuclease SbcCD nuclease subunit
MTSVSVIAIGDQHFKCDNMEEVDKFIEKIEELALEKNPDFIVLLGDLLHTHEKIHCSPLNKAYEFIDKMRKISKTYILVGNHDMCNNSQFLTENHWLNGLKDWTNVTIVDKVVYEEIDGLKFVFAPYVYTGRFEEALNTIGDTWKDVDCIFAHQEFYGCKMGCFDSVDGDKWLETYPQVISGHIHLNQKLQNNIYYPGSAMQNAFGESEKNIIPYLNFTNGISKYGLEEIDLSLPRKYIVYFDNIDKVEEYNEPSNDDKVKLSISGSLDEFKIFKKNKDGI